MKQVASIVQEKVVHISQRHTLRDVRFVSCVMLADPKSMLVSADNVHCFNCTFLYDGMEVDGSEWLALMRREPRPSH